MTFEEWVITIAKELKECKDIVRKRVPPGQNLYGAYLEELLDISGVINRLYEEASEYWHDRVALEHDNLIKLNPKANRKTLLDLAKSLPTSE